MTERRFEIDASLRFRRVAIGGKKEKMKVTEKAIEKAAAKTVGTPRRTIRVADELWSTAQQVASQRGEDLSLVIRRALEDYIAGATEEPAI